MKYSDLLSEKRGVEKHFLGFGGELYLSAEEITRYDTGIINNIKSFVEKDRLPLRLHAPIAEIDYSQIKDTFLRLKPLYGYVIKFCKALGINHVVAHAELNYDSVFPIDKQLAGAVSVWRALGDDLSANNIHISIENHCEREPTHLVMLMKKVRSPYLAMCVDLGHFNAFSDLSAQNWLEKYPVGSIKEIHLADNKGDDDTHLPVGDGNIDFAAFFKNFDKRGEDCAFVLEPRNISEAKKSISFLRKEGMIE
ncbi:MAG: sugar phosphate isomerase/epimerase [Candidatus Omnitrophica bacterium]|nr:sugar phosphate isomerase/epimerase [Candidatus Omnitrophota bacterium]